MSQKYGNNSGTGIQIEENTRVKKPKMYRVILHNDHYTTMDFVVEVLVKVFKKQPAEATGIMLEVHNRGKGLCGVFTYDIALTKASQVHQMARAREFPLKCSVEEA
ncbi:MAG: ATP-dependent Clp protease adapter ClpS [Spirochaetota bacterium]